MPPASTPDAFGPLNVAMPAQGIGAASSDDSSSGIDTRPVPRAIILSAQPPSQLEPGTRWLRQGLRRPLRQAGRSRQGLPQRPTPTRWPIVRPSETFVPRATMRPTTSWSGTRRAAGSAFSMSPRSTLADAPGPDRSQDFARPGRGRRALDQTEAAGRAHLRQRGMICGRKLPPPCSMAARGEGEAFTWTEQDSARVAFHHAAGGGAALSAGFRSQRRFRARAGAGVGQGTPDPRDAARRLPARCPARSAGQSPQAAIRSWRAPARAGSASPDRRTAAPRSRTPRARHPLSRP